MRRIGLLLVALAGLSASPAYAQRTFPTTTGDRVAGTVPLTCDAAGANCTPTVTPTAPAQAGADGQATTVTGSTTNARGYVFNGTTWDRARGDTTGQYVVEVPSPVAAAGVAALRTTVASSSLVGKASAGNLYSYNAVSGASAGYLLIYNAATAPADGTVSPARCIPLAANTGIEVDLRGQPTYFSTGITFVFSTTGCFTQTASATAFIAADVR